MLPHGCRLDASSDQHEEEKHAFGPTTPPATRNRATTDGSRMQWNLGRPVIRNPLIGRRVRLDRCNNPESHVRPGSLGTIGFVDSLGTVHVNWDDGADLGLVPGKDRWTLLTEEAAWPSILAMPKQRPTWRRRCL